MKRMIVGVIVTLSLATLAGCGGDDTPSSTSDGAVATSETTATTEPAPKIPTFEGDIPAVVHDAGTTDVLEFMVAHQGQIVHLNLTFDGPPYADVTPTRGNITVFDDACGPGTEPRDCGGLEFTVSNLDATSDSTLAYEHGAYLLKGYFAVVSAGSVHQGVFSTALRPVSIETALQAGRLTPIGASPTTTTSAPTTTTTTAPVGRLDQVNWTKAIKDVDCTEAANKGIEVTGTRFGDVSGDYIPDAVVWVRCAESHSTWTDQLEVFDGTSTAAAPKKLGVLVRVDEHLSIKSVSATREAVTIEGVTWADSDANCCPSLTVQRTFRWNGRAFVEDPVYDE